MDWSSLLTGGAIALLSFALGAGLTAWFRRRDAQLHGWLVLRATAEALSANHATAVNDLNLVRTDLAGLADPLPATFLNPLDVLDVGFWEQLRGNLPEELLADLPTVDHLRTCARLTAQVNQMVQSRETFRHSDPLWAPGDPDPNLHSRWLEGLRQYDRLLEEFLGQLIDALASAQAGVVVWLPATHRRGLPTSPGV